MAADPRPCAECGRPEIRRHRHKDRSLAGNVREGRQVAWLERQWIRALLKDAESRITRL